MTSHKNAPFPRTLANSNPASLYPLPQTPEQIASAVITEDSYSLGMECLAQADYDKAIHYFNALAQKNHNDLEALNKLGYCLFKAARYDIAIRCYSLALQIAPDHPVFVRGLADCYTMKGDFKEAKSLYKGLLKKNPDDVLCLLCLVLIGETGADTEIAKKLKELYKSENCTGNDRIMVCYALGKIYQAQKDVKQSFLYYDETNRLQREYITYDEAGVLQYFNDIQQIFNKELFAKLGHVGIDEPGPIFVIGMPRSGTTLVEQILASHEQVHGAGEIYRMPEVAMRLIPQMTGLPFPQAIHALKPEAYKPLAENYLRGIRSYCKDKPYIVDKMLNNYFNVGLIHLLFPNAPIIHCVRDPMDTCWSIFREQFTGAHPYSYDQKSLGNYYLRYQELMQYWHTVLPGRVYDIQYEALIENPEKNIRGLIEHCKLPWDEKCLHFSETERTVSTASMKQVRSPIYKTSLKSWAPVANELAELRQILGAE